ncbi:MAG TPA: hypothetical protein EYO73_07975 [Sulfurimonas sp.]|nr:hypothetical protein [Sulfurimonas sp.]
MSTTTLMILLGILLLILVPLLLSYFIFPDDKAPIEFVKKMNTPPVISRDKPLSFEEILEVFGDTQSSKETLREVIEQLIKHHGKIHAKLGDLPHPDFKRYLSLIIVLCNNPKADKDIIIALDQKLCTKNPRYALNIDEAVNKGIAARGF